MAYAHDTAHYATGGIDADLASAVEAMMPAALTTPWDAHDQCYRESKRFAAILTNLAIPHDIVMGYQREQYAGHDVIVQGHVAVRVRDEVYDWTARQFDPDASVPKIMTVEEWQSAWPDL